MDGVTGSLERVVAILDLFTRVHAARDSTAGVTSLGVTDVSRQLQLPKGTVSRYLSRLEEVGILQRLPDRRYVLGNRVYHWGQAAAPGQEVRPWARPVMERLAQQYGEMVSLMVRDGDEAICIDQVDGRHLIRLTAVRGRRLALNTGASPRVLLTFAPEEVREDYISRCVFTRHASGTIMEPERLRRSLAEIRQRGYAVSQSELDEGVVSFAAPIRNAAGQVVASISSAGPETRLQGAAREALIAGVIEAAAQASVAIGYRAHESGTSMSERVARTVEPALSLYG